MPWLTNDYERDLLIQYRDEFIFVESRNLPIRNSNKDKFIFVERRDLAIRNSDKGEFIFVESHNLPILNSNKDEFIFVERHDLAIRNSDKGMCFDFILNPCIVCKRPSEHFPQEFCNGRCG